MLAFIVAATKSSAALTTHSINLINKDDARRVFLGLLKHVSNTRRTDADEHLNEIRTGDRKERYFRFARNCFREERLTSTRRADEQHATGNASTKLLKLARILQEINDFSDFFFGFIATGDVSKCGRVVGFVEQACFAFTKAERTAFAAALHLAHHEHPRADEQQDRTK